MISPYISLYTVLSSWLIENIAGKCIFMGRSLEKNESNINHYVVDILNPQYRCIYVHRIYVLHKIDMFKYVKRYQISIFSDADSLSENDEETLIGMIAAISMQNCWYKRKEKLLI